MQQVYAYTDGSCSGNPGVGGWGVLLRCQGKEKELSGAEAHTTNNRMEMAAAIHALEHLKHPCRVQLVTDSRYLQRGVEEWLADWRRRGWRTAAGKPVKNRDLWQRLEVALQRHRVELRWVEGHSGHADNDRADRLARTAARTLLQEPEA